MSDKWDNRIVGHGEEAPEDLLAHPLNFRIHSALQQNALLGAISDVGYLRSVTVSRNSGRVIDGHLRVMLAMRTGQKTIPVEYVDLSEAEEAEALVTLDPIGALATVDKDKLNELLAEVSTTDESLMQMLAELAADAGLGYEMLEAGAKGEDEVLTVADVPDAIFPTDNEWGIPLLDIRLQAEAVDAPVTKWGTIARTSRMEGTWHFYANDYKFSALWGDASPVVNSRCVNAIEPNFSMNDQAPRAVGLYRIFQKRWLARWWQEHGIKIFVDLNVPQAYFDLNLLGVPTGWRAYATKAMADFETFLPQCWELARRHRGSDDVLLVVIGGRDQVKQFCHGRGWVHIYEWEVQSNG